MATAQARREGARAPPKTLLTVRAPLAKRGVQCWTGAVVLKEKAAEASGGLTELGRAQRGPPQASTLEKKASPGWESFFAA